MRRTNRSTQTSRGSGRVSQVQSSRGGRRRNNRSTVSALRNGAAVIEQGGVYNYAGPKGAIIRITPANAGRGGGRAQGERHSNRGRGGYGASGAKQRHDLRARLYRATEVGRARQKARNRIARERGWADPDGKLPIYLMNDEQKSYYRDHGLLPPKGGLGRDEDNWMLGGNVAGSELVPFDELRRPPTAMPKPPQNRPPGRPVVTPVADRQRRFLAILNQRSTYA